MTETVCGVVEMEEHLECGCGCDVSRAMCNVNQQFLEYECRCACNNHNERDTCLAIGWHWDRDTCKCMCPHRPYPTCPNNYMFDYLDTCSCIPVHSEATLGLLTLLVIVTVLTFSALGYYASKIVSIGRLLDIFSNSSSKNKVEADISIISSSERNNLLSS